MFQLILDPLFHVLGIFRPYVPCSIIAMFHVPDIFLTPCSMFQSIFHPMFHVPETCVTPLTNGRVTLKYTSVTDAAAEV